MNYRLSYVTSNHMHTLSFRFCPTIFWNGWLSWSNNFRMAKANRLFLCILSSFRPRTTTMVQVGLEFNLSEWTNDSAFRIFITKLDRNTFGFFCVFFFGSGKVSNKFNSHVFKLNIEYFLKTLQKSYNTTLKDHLFGMLFMVIWWAVTLNDIINIFLFGVSIFLFLARSSLVTLHRTSL